MQDVTTAPQALTTLSEEEMMFRDAVAGFADDEVRPRVAEMESGAFDPDLIPKFFELGLMGIEVAEQYGGAGGSLFMVALAVEEISKSTRRRRSWSTCRTRSSTTRSSRYGSDDAEVEVPAACSPRDTVGAYALSEAGSGSDAFGLATRAEKKGDRWVLNGRKLWITNGAEARIFVVFANAESARRLQGNHGVHRRARLPGLQRRQEGRQARHPRVEHDRADPRRLPRCPTRTCSAPSGKGYKIAIETLNEGRIGIGAQMIGVAHGALDARHRLREGAQAVRQAARRVPGHPVPARAGGDGARGGAADGLQRGAAQGRGPATSRAKARWRSCSRRRWRSA